MKPLRHQFRGTKESTYNKQEEPYGRVVEISLTYAAEMSIFSHKRRTQLKHSSLLNITRKIFNKKCGRIGSRQFLYCYPNNTNNLNFQVTYYIPIYLLDKVMGLLFSISSPKSIFRNISRLDWLNYIPFINILPFYPLTNCDFLCLLNII